MGIGIPHKVYLGSTIYNVKNDKKCANIFIIQNEALKVPVGDMPNNNSRTIIIINIIHTFLL